jgi:fatty acid amide hydrolase
MDELWAQPATELKAALEQGHTTSEAIVRAHLDRIEAVDDGVRAFTEVLAEDALATAKRMDAERAAGQLRGPLHGLPVTVKECLAMQGRASTVGLLARRGVLSTSDSALITLLREGGAVILGRTNLSQNMIYAECNNPVFGTTTNPFSNAHTPGGSSGGEGAAVAAGMSCLGVGTDIGGSEFQQLFAASMRLCQPLIAGRCGDR